MSRRKKELNPKSSERLREFLKEQDLQGIELAKKTHYTQQMISRIVQGHANVSELLAEKIVECYPQYIKEWFLGENVPKTQFHKFIGLVGETNDEVEKMMIGLQSFAEVNGYRIVNSTEIHNNEELTVENIVNVIKSLSYRIENGDRQVVITYQQLNSLQNDISDYVEFRLNRFIEKGC